MDPDDALPALPALIALHAEMQREFHHNRADIPVSVNLDDWLVRIAAIIDVTPAADGPQEDRDRRVKTAFAEGYNAYGRQFTAQYDLDAAWEQSISKQALGITEPI